MKAFVCLLVMLGGM